MARGNDGEHALLASEVTCSQGGTSHCHTLPVEGEQAEELNDPCDKGSGQERPEGLAGCGWKPHRSNTCQQPELGVLKGMRQYRSSDQARHFAEDGASSNTRISAQPRATCHKPMMISKHTTHPFGSLIRQMMCSYHPSMTSHVIYL